MKSLYLFTAIAMLSLMACKKDTAPATPIGSTQEDDYTICTQENWVTNISSEAVDINFTFVIADKFYSVRNIEGDTPGDDVIHIYDGTSWTTIDSDIPLGTNHRNFSFSIGSKGYAAICFTNPDLANRFYEYNPVTNGWTRKADFPGDVTSGFATFTVSGKGYVVGGSDNGDYTNKTWEYNPATNTWRERKNLFLNRAYAIGFSIGNKGYITNGNLPNNLGYYQSLVEYDPLANTWTEKAEFPGAGRIWSQCFVIGNNAYVGGGLNQQTSLRDFYKYSQANNTWTRIANPVATGSFTNQPAFSINSKGFASYNSSEPRLAKFNPRVCTTVITGPIPGSVN
jgi:hypothetical protein